MLNCRERRPLAFVARESVEASQRLVPPLAGRELSPTPDLDGDLLDDLTRPLLVGYIRRGLLSSEDEIAQLESEMAMFARLEGYSMGYNYVENSDRTFAALAALVEFLRGQEDAAVIIPSPMHFLSTTEPRNLRTAFEQATGVRVHLLAS